LGVWAVLLYRRARYGYEFRLIRMTQPKYAKVDTSDYERLRKFEWFAKKGRKSFYALRYARTGKKGKLSLIYMHQMVIKIPDGMVVDHINQHGMDNRTTNLRAATWAQNMCNRNKFSYSTGSKYKGVHWDKNLKRWIARIMFNKKRIYLGSFRDEIEAAKAYDNAARKYHAEFACLNFPDAK